MFRVMDPRTIFDPHLSDHFYSDSFIFYIDRERHIPKRENLDYSGKIRENSLF